jgi:hypothetical protein
MENRLLEQRGKTMTIQIDDAFITRWHPEFDRPEVGGDDSDYYEILERVQGEINSNRTLTQKTFLEIWKWKGAMRVIRFVKLEEYDSLYAPAFRRAAEAPPERKLYELLEGTKKLPGVGAPTGSTLIHFIHPEIMPIIDVRTVEVLYAAGRISTELRELESYEEYRAAIDRIKRECAKSTTLRKIDRALFAYHKLVLDKNRKERTLCRTENSAAEDARATVAATVRATSRSLLTADAPGER